MHRLAVSSSLPICSISVDCLTPRSPSSLRVLSCMSTFSISSLRPRPSTPTSSACVVRSSLPSTTALPFHSNAASKLAARQSKSAPPYHDSR